MIGMQKSLMLIDKYNCMDLTSSLTYLNIHPISIKHISRQSTAILIFLKQIRIILKRLRVILIEPSSLLVILTPRKKRQSEISQLWLGRIKRKQVMKKKELTFKEVGCLPEMIQVLKNRLERQCKISNIQVFLKMIFKPA